MFEVWMAGGETPTGQEPAPPAALAGEAAASSLDRRDALIEHLAAMTPGGDLAVVLERVVSQLLVAANPPESCPGEGCSDGECCCHVGPVMLLPDLLHTGERCLVESATSVRLDGCGAGAGMVVDLGAEVVGELLAAASRLRAWAGWAEAVLAALLARTADMSTRADQWSAAAPRASRDERVFNAAGEIACQLGVSRTRATGVIERGEALLDGVLAPVECLHRAGLVDEAKTSLIARRLRFEDAGVARAVQERVLPGAAHRTHCQLAKDLEHALADLDPQGARARRQRNHADRHVSRPHPAGQGASRMTLLLPTPDAFLLDATLDAIGASARAMGDVRTLSQLRADALTTMALATLRGSQAAAAATAQPAAQVVGQPAAQPTAQSTAQVVGQPADQSACLADAVGIADAVGDAGMAGVRKDAGLRPGLLPDGVPLEGLLASLSGLMSSTGPWWSPSGNAPVYPPPGLTVRVDVTVALDQLVDLLDDPAPTSPGGSAPPGGDPGAPVMVLHGVAGSDGHAPPVAGGSAAGGSGAVLTIGGRHAPVPAVVARALAAGGTWRRLVTDPLSGTVVDMGRTRYRPPAALADLVRARDRSCTHPGCQAPAARCDIDHVRPWAEGGTTSWENLVCLCQAHHRLKHTPGWALTRTPEGSLTWRTPTGARYERRADGSVRRLPQRVGPRGVTRPGGRVPAWLERAITASVIARLDKGLDYATMANTPTQTRTQPQGGTQAQVQGRARTRTQALTVARGQAQTQPVLETRGPYPGERAGAFEPVPYDRALHILGLAPLLDEIPPY